MRSIGKISLFNRIPDLRGCGAADSCWLGVVSGCDGWSLCLPFVDVLGDGTHGAETDATHGTVLALVVVAFVLDGASVLVGTEMAAETGDYVEITAFHLTGHFSYDYAGTEEGGDTVDRIVETSAEANIVSVSS